MAKKRRDHTPEVVVTHPSPPPMRAAIPGTRSVKDLRSAEMAEFRHKLIQVYNEVKTNDARIRKQRPVARENNQNQTSGRHVPSLAELRNERMPAQVRHELQDGIRILACAGRRTRREVIFALRKAGKNGKGNRKAQWTAKSYLRCK